MTFLPEELPAWQVVGCGDESGGNAYVVTPFKNFYPCYLLLACVSHETLG